MEVWGQAFEHLQGVFGLRIRVVRMRLGGEAIELTEYLAPKGRSFPAHTRSNDRWFQHIAIIVTDMDRAYHRLRQHKVSHASSGPRRLRSGRFSFVSPNAVRVPEGTLGFTKAFLIRDPDGHVMQMVER